MSKEFKFLNLLVLAPHMSVTAKVSILHRITGFLIFLLLPFIIYFLNSITHEPANLYLIWQEIMQNCCAKVFYLVILWIISFYICAEIRFFILDLHIGLSKKSSQFSAWLVLAFSLIISLSLFGVSLL